MLMAVTTQRPRDCQRCSARDGHDSALHEAQRFTGGFTHPAYPGGKAGLKLSESY